MFGNKCQSIIRAKKIDHTFVFICYSFNVFYIIKKEDILWNTLYLDFKIL